MQLFEEAFETREKKQDALISVNLSHNGLSTLATVTSLAQEFPNLKNIDLSNNELRSFGALGHWRRRFRSLDLMILSDNPIEQAIPNYHEEIISWYPTLRFLNGIQVRSDETVAALLQSRANAAQGALPFPVGTPSFTDIDGIAERFLLDFFALYDKDRAALAAKYYDPHSMFSLSVNNSSHSDKAGKMAPGTWDAYIRKSRSLSKLDNTRAIIAREHDGVSQVSKCWSSLPTTHHPSMTTENAKWLVESHTISGLPAPSMPPGTSVSGLLLTIHGEFDELDHAKAKRSFDRSFVLGPGAAPGSVRVISDMLILRAYGGSEAWLVDPAVTQANLERAQKEHMVMEFSQKSRLNLKYALLCLEESEWNWDTAVANFESAKVCFC
jgi:nuclear RNA export factor